MSLSLNEEAVADLDDTESFVTEPSFSDDDSGQTAVVVADPTALELPTEAISALQDYDVKLVTLQDNAVKLHDLDEVTETILASESISRSDAEHYAGTLGEDFSTQLPLNEFTETPSRTNLRETQRFAETQRDHTENEVRKMFEAFVETEWSHVSHLVSWVQGPVVNQLLEQLEELSRIAQEDLPVVSASKHFYVLGVSNEMVDIRNYDLNSCGLSSTVRKLWPEFEEVFSRLFTALRSKEFQQLQFLSSRPALPDTKALHLWKSEKEFNSITYFELNNLFGSNALGRTILALRENVLQKWPELDSRLKDADLVMVDQSLPEVGDFLKQLMHLQQIVIVLRSVVLYGRVILKFFSDQAEAKL